MAADDVDKYTDCVTKKHAVFDEQHVVKVLLWTSYQIFKKKGQIDRTSIFRRGLLEKKWVTFFRGNCNFYIKNELKSKISNDKKVYKQIFFFCHN